MKFIAKKEWCLVFLFFVLVAPEAIYAQGTVPDKEAISNAILNFAQGADRQIPEQVSLSLHSQSWQFMPAPNGVRAFNQEQYLSLLKAKKIGGTPREMKIESIDIIEGYMASARVQLQKDTTVFIHLMSLMKVGESWQIMNILTLVGTDN